jgi:hypothetical protein
MTTSVNLAPNSERYTCWGNEGGPRFSIFSVWASWAFWVDNNQCVLEVVLLGWFVFCLAFWVVFISSWFFSQVYL